ncbi:uncharacterized protein THITE_116258 [Thermothielavioides terrestris NRRL 8126]|uniref:Uncharacterized protein n=1 Tax=Thermothielavioides terrestris (strain ATCC 38088 / NRRL 8126) TaxID=578455 RepID=G2QVY7_THETT|nr:uncharacterized protein THITE_116258 [Thermothielavioides terrestris NRRL 8126]AEO64719.1 hypothetical protein THITE_116258 [Thermothielavioides terrestris NRRL 8126]
MCVSSFTTDPHPVTTNVGIGQCAGTAGAGAEIYAHAPHRTLLPANLAAAVEGGDDPAASFDLLFATGRGDYSPCEDMQMVLLEFVADPLGRATALRHLREEI